MEGPTFSERRGEQPMLSFDESGIQQHIENKQPKGDGQESECIRILNQPEIRGLGMGHQ
jgi:hypothetical protein